MSDKDTFLKISEELTGLMNHRSNYYGHDDLFDDLTLTLECYKIN